MRALIAGIATFATIAVAIAIVDGFQFPGFERLPPPTGPKNVFVHDVAAMSALTGKDLLPRAGNTPEDHDSIAYYNRIVDPRHVDLETANDREGRLRAVFYMPDAVVNAAFASAVRAEPRAYFERRLAVFRELVGATDGPTFVATHVGVDDNDYGYVHRPSRLTPWVLDYIATQSHSLIGKPWLYYLLGTLALAISIARRKSVDCAAAIAVYASGAFYLLPLFFITPAADVRYNHWPLVCAFIVVALAVAPVARPRSARVELRA